MVELVDALAEMGMDTATCSLCIFLQSLVQANPPLLFFLKYVKLQEVDPSSSSAKVPDEGIICSSWP